MNTPYVFKKCSKCGRWLVANTINFSKRKDSNDGLKGQCKECMKDYYKNYYEEKEKCYIESIKNNSGEHTVLYKKCTKCGRLLVANTDNFYKQKGGKYGLSSWCIECQNVSNKKWYEDNRKRSKEECPDGYKKCTKCGRMLPANTDNFYRDRSVKCGLVSQCKECASAHDKIYHKQHKQHKQKRAEYNKKYYEETKEEQREKKKKYYQTSQGQVALFNNNNRRRKREEQQGKGITPDQWLEMMKFFDWKCAYSGEYIGNKENQSIRSIDHIVPLAKGGVNEIWNCVPMYRPYNTSKHDKDIKEWYPQQDFYSEDRLNKINEWREYAYNKWSNKVNTKTI